MTVNQHFEKGLTTKQIIEIYLSHWRVFVGLAAFFLVLGLVIFFLKIPYVANSSMVFNDSQNSSIQAFSSQFFGLSKSIQESKKGSSVLSKHIDFLKTREFMELLLQRASGIGESEKLKIEERSGYQQLKTDYLVEVTNPEKKIEVLQKLDKWIKVTLDSDFEIKVAVSTPHKEMSLFLANTMIALAAEELRKKELEEINRIENFVFQQKEITNVRIQDLGKQFALTLNKDENLLPFASKEKMGDYVTDLLVRSNEIKMKISENRKLIEQFEKNRSDTKESALYGMAGKISNLEIENNLLSSKLFELHMSISNLRKDLRKIPFQAEFAEDLKRKSEIEYGRYRELSTALEKIEAVKLSIGSRFEVLDPARWETTLPLLGLNVLILISILISQFAGSLFVYFRFLWNPHVFIPSEVRSESELLNNGMLDNGLLNRNGVIGKGEHSWDFVRDESSGAHH